MISLDSYLDNCKTAAISGHVRPDGDCAGSCLAVYNYIKDQYPEIVVDLYLEPIPKAFQFLKYSQDIISLDQESANQESLVQEYDTFIALDCGDASRLGDAKKYFDTARQTICIDHHVTNENFADFNYIFPTASSTCELVYGLLPEDFITKEIAECLYLGIVHDTGVFQYSCTSSKTMQIAGKLMDKGIDYPKIVDQTFFLKNYTENRILGKALVNSELHFDGVCISSILKKKHLEKYHAEPKDLSAVVSTLRSTEGVEVAVFLYASKENSYKVSMRSASYIDVAKIATEFGGGGHARAAGATIDGKGDEILKKILSRIKTQIKEHEQACTMES